MTTAVDKVVAQMPMLTREHVLTEAGHDPAFWNYFTPLALSPGGAVAVDDDMKRALVNELNPSRFPEAQGRWPMFRALARNLVSLARTGAPPTGLGAPPAAGADAWSTIGAGLSLVGGIIGQREQAKLEAARRKHELRMQAMLTAAEERARQRELEAQRLAAERAAAAAQMAAATGQPPGTYGTPGIPGRPPVGPPAEGTGWGTYALVTAGAGAALYAGSQLL